MQDMTEIECQFRLSLVKSSSEYQEGMSGKGYFKRKKTAFRGGYDIAYCLFLFVLIGADNMVPGVGLEPTQP